MKDMLLTLLEWIYDLNFPSADASIRASILQGCIFSHALIQPLGAFPHSYRLTKTYISLSLGHDLEPSWFSKGGIQGKNIYYTAQMYTISFVQDIHKLLMWRNFILGTAYTNSLYVHFMTRSLLSLRLH